MNTDTKKIIDKLTNRDKKENLEVEHLLALLHTNNKELVQPLIQLKQKHDWRQINDELIIPFGTWADIICVYLEHGYSGLTNIGKSKNELSFFAINALEELKTKESFDSLYEILASLDLNKEEDLPFILETISSLNFVTSFKGRPDVDNAKAKLVTDYIVATIEKLVSANADDEAKISTCVLSLRGIGNLETIDFISQLAPMTRKEYLGVNTLTINSIKKRLLRK